MKTASFKNWAFLLPCAYSVFLFLYTQWDTFFNPYLINDDIVQHQIWLYRFIPNGFLPHDPLITTSEMLQPWGYWLVCRVVAFFLDPLTASRYLSLLPLAGTAIFTFLLLRKKFGIALAMAGVVLMCNYPFDRMVGFNARAFGFPLLMAFLYYLTEKRLSGISVTVVLGALFYPVMVPIAGVILGLHYTWKIITEQGIRRFRRADLIPAGGLAIAVLIVLLKSWQFLQSDLFGPKFSREAVKAMPEFSRWGRVNFEFQLNPNIILEFHWEYFFRLPYLEIVIWTVLAAMLGQAIWRRRLPSFDLSLLGLLISGFALTLLAQAWYPLLFLPQRYVIYPMVPFMYLLIIRGLGFIPPRLRNGIPGMLLLALFVYEGFFFRDPQHTGLKNYNHFKALYESVEKVPAGSLIAGPLAACSHIPVFCRRSVLFSEEAAHAIYFKDQHALIMPKIEAFLKAYASKDLGKVKAFVKEYGVDYLILKKSFFEKGEMYVFRPFIGQLREATAGKKREDYALMQIPSDWVIEVDEEYALVNCSRF